MLQQRRKGLDETTENRDARFNTAYQRDRLSVEESEMPGYSLHAAPIVLFEL